MAWVLMAIVCVPIVGTLFVRSVARSVAPNFDFDEWNLGYAGLYVSIPVMLVLAVLTARRIRRSGASLAEAPASGTPDGEKTAPVRPRRSGRKWKWAAAAVVVFVVLFGGVLFGREAVLYVTDRGELQVDGDSTVAVIVLRDGETVADWSSLSFGRRIKLPPGRYTLKARSTSLLHRVSGWREFDLNRFGSRGGSTKIESDLPYDLDVEVKRGRRVVVEPVTRSRPMAEVQADLDSEALQGEWVAEKIEFQGKSLPEEVCRQFRLTFAGGNARLTLPGGKVVEGRFHLDASRLPREIDIIGKDGKWVRGVYHPAPDHLHRRDRRPAADEYRAEPRSQLEADAGDPPAALGRRRRLRRLRAGVDCRLGLCDQSEA